MDQAPVAAEVGPEVRTLAAVRVTPEAFAPFGRPLGFDDCDEADRVVGRFSGGQQPMPSIIREVNPDGVPRCGWLARHLHQTQALTPIDGAIVAVLVPAGADPLGPGGLGAATAFVAEPGEGFQIDEGVWHWAASVRRGAVRVANLQGHRWPEDNEIVSLEDHGVELRPTHPWLDREWAADLLAVGTAELLALGRARPRPDLAARRHEVGTGRRADGPGWVVVDDHGAAELDDDTVAAIVRSRPTRPPH